MKRLAIRAAFVETVPVWFLFFLMTNPDYGRPPLGNYLLLEKIGQGGMGAVYKAEHRRMKRIVAIKMLPRGRLKDAAAATRFQREVEAAARLEHPNIVTAYDADEANGAHFLVMQYVEGSDLSALVKQHGPLPVAQAVHCILQAAKGLEFAHGEGVVHRDIKPANLCAGRHLQPRLHAPQDIGDDQRKTGSRVLEGCRSQERSQAAVTPALSFRSRV